MSSNLPMAIGAATLLLLAAALAAPLAAEPSASAEPGIAAAVAPQDKKGPIDDMNPRAPTTPLKIELAPWWCTICVEEERIKAEPHELTLLKRPVAKFTEQMGLKKGEWLAMETPHFKIFSMLADSNVKYNDSIYARADLDRLKGMGFSFSMGPDSAKLDAHVRMHMYQVRLERQYAHFVALTGNTKPHLGMGAKPEIYLWSDYTPHHDFCDRYIGGKNDKGGVQWHFPEPPNYYVFSCAEAVVTAQTAKGDGAVANHVFHNVAHLLVDSYNNYTRETPAWLEEGLGHYYERRENPRWNNFCWAEGRPPTDFTKPDWEVIIFTIVRRDKDTPFAIWCEKLQPGELSGIENGLSWSIVKWLIETEPLRFTKMLEAMHDLSRNLKPGELIQDAFGCSSNVLYQRWREYVLKEYAGK